MYICRSLSEGRLWSLCLQVVLKEIMHNKWNLIIGSQLNMMDRYQLDLPLHKIQWSPLYWVSKYAENFGPIKGIIEHGPRFVRPQNSGINLAQLSGMPNYPGAELSGAHCTVTALVIIKSG